MIVRIKYVASYPVHSISVRLFYYISRSKCLYSDLHLYDTYKSYDGKLEAFRHNLILIIISFFNIPRSKNIVSKKLLNSSSILRKNIIVYYILSPNKVIFFPEVNHCWMLYTPDSGILRFLNNYHLISVNDLPSVFALMIYVHRIVFNIAYKCYTKFLKLDYMKSAM